MDTTSENDAFEAGDGYTRRLREALGSRLSLLSVFVGDRQILLGADGLPEQLQGVREIPLVAGFCKHVKDTGAQLIVDDVRDETGIATHPLVVELGIEAYAGWHVTDESGRPVAVLCAMDDHPRAWSSGELLTLMELAHDCGSIVRGFAARAERGSAV
ncbi:MULTISPECIES: GAF domain-containing protein [Nocardioides]|uniref:GAF domain-containing protein n=1 Tax=Nocardioides lianchengensis TaxID=1045774 RepID=A0A1G6JCA1_9ACTN|nr:GAF domain-containing protein [Nocardioides lianchengensis]NYG12788.1 GAF domain-containing protein [Nocardioides lianchengensis]SDC16320.1 GAF domain-containing protein [Nocardioides lianchengensis]